MFSVYGKMQTSGLSEFIPFIGTSAARGQICFQMLYILNSFFTTRGGRCDGWLLLASHLFTPPAIAMVGGGGICWMFWEPSFTLGGLKSLTAVTYLAH